MEKSDSTDGAAKVLSNLARGTKWCVTDTTIGDNYLNKGPLKDKELTYYYALKIIQGRWPEAEPVILKDPELSVDCAIDIIKGRWPTWAYQYARNIIDTKQG